MHPGWRIPRFTAKSPCSQSIIGQSTRRAVCTHWTYTGHQIDRVVYLCSLPLAMQNPGPTGSIPKFYIRQTQINTFDFAFEWQIDKFKERTINCIDFTMKSCTNQSSDICTQTMTSYWRLIYIHSMCRQEFHELYDLIGNDAHILLPHCWYVCRYRCFTPIDGAHIRIIKICPI